ncbi:MAG: TIGR01777 family oxidoreductase [candidate division Zixibacteria bacterium]|nr:TIGR01777 family oxidoreductase [candidate division Zixibacteria bacterium]
MKIAITGASGLIGSALVTALVENGHQVTKLVRPGGPVGAGSIAWAPDQGKLESAALEGFDTVFHLAGESIAEGKWTEAKKRKILESRVRSTSLLCGRLKNLSSPPSVAVFASAIGIYGNRGDDELTEESTPGEGFLATVTKEWEAASEILADTAIRVVKLRFGVVLSEKGGALPAMIKPFKLGLGGKIGRGTQYISWISIDDVINIMQFVIREDQLRGPINAISPNPVTNAEFTTALGQALNRPSAASVPAFAIRLMVGREMADEMLLASTRVIPKKLQDAGYRFLFPYLQEALRYHIERLK